MVQEFLKKWWVESDFKVIDSTEDCKILKNEISYRLYRFYWAHKWGMRFQPITRKKKHHIDFEYQLEGSKLEFVDNIKYLGVHIANDLRWNKHAHEVTNKANKLLGMLRRNLYFCTKDVREISKTNT